MTEDSLSDWGGFYSSLTVQGTWSLQELSLSIGIVELRASRLPLYTGPSKSTARQCRRCGLDKPPRVN